MRRENMRQLWADEAFVQKLEELRARRTIIGKPIKSVSALTREIMNTEAFKDIEKEILSVEKIMMRVKYDKNL